jgi:hypothetical protein
MSWTLNLAAYQQLIDDDLAWAESMPRTLERDHVLDVLRWCRVHRLDDVDRLTQEIKRLHLLNLSASYLLLACEGPKGGPTSWQDTRARWFEHVGLELGQTALAPSTP